MATGVNSRGQVLQSNTLAERGRHVMELLRELLATRASQAPPLPRGGTGADAHRQPRARSITNAVMQDLTPLMVLVAVVHSAGVQDRDGARLVFAKLREHFCWLKKVWADAAYAGPKLAHWVQGLFSWMLEIVTRSQEQVGFQVQPKRWIVERTFGWLNRSRRLSKDYERLPETEEAWIYAALTRLMLRRLARQPLAV